MKKYLFLVCILLLTISLTGCVKGDVHLTVNKDKSADTEIMVGIQNSFYALASSDKDPFADLSKKLKSEGFSISKHKDNEYTGIKAVKHFDNVEKMKLNQKADKQPFKIKKTESFFQTTYQVTGNFDMSNMLSNDKKISKKDKELASIVTSQFDFNLDVTLPVKSKENNADSFDVKTKTLHWDLIPETDNKISFVASVPNVKNIAITAVISFVLIGFIVILSFRKKTAKKTFLGQ